MLNALLIQILAKLPVHLHVHVCVFYQNTYGHFETIEILKNQCTVF